MDEKTEVARQRGAWQPALGALIRFGLFVALLAFVFSLLAMPWVHLSWLRIFRRCASIAAATSLLIIVKRLEGRSFRSYGLVSPKVGKFHLALGLLIGFTGLGLMLGVCLISGVCRTEVTSDSLRLWRTLLGFLPACILIGVLEELVFRGFILQHLLVYSKVIAVVGSSALYAVVHVKSLSFTTATWLELVGLFLLGVVLASSYLSTGQLWLPIGLHAALAYGARINKLVVSFPDTSISWLVGTSRLVNGVAAWVILLAVWGIIGWWARRFSVQGRGGA